MSMCVYYSWIFIHNQPQPRKRMTVFRRVLRRPLHPLKLVIVTLVFVTFLFLIQWEVGAQSQQEDPWLKEMAVKRDSMLGMVMGAVNNFKHAMPKMQIKAPVRQQDKPGGASCLPGHYTAAELRPALERPPQNPLSPGAAGKPFHTDSLSPEEQKEKERGEEKHCFNVYASDRVSLSRDLGADTRPPEYVNIFINFLCRHSNPTLLSNLSKLLLFTLSNRGKCLAKTAEMIVLTKILFLHAVLIFVAEFR